MSNKKPVGDKKVRVYRAVELDLEGVRNHPWITSINDPTCRYYDFKKQPELIATSLEDFIPWSQYPAIQSFYDMLHWMRGTTSELDTDDCAFGGIKGNGTPAFNKTKQSDGRLMLFYRRLQYNCTDQSAKWLMDCFEFHLQRVETAFEWGVIGLSTATTFFDPIKTQGQSLILNFWSLGDTEDEVMKNLSAVFAGMFAASQKVSQQITEILGAKV